MKTGNGSRRGRGEGNDARQVLVSSSFCGVFFCLQPEAFMHICLLQMAVLQRDGELTNVSVPLRSTDLRWVPGEPVEGESVVSQLDLRVDDTGLASLTVQYEGSRQIWSQP